MLTEVFDKVKKVRPVEEILKKYYFNSYAHENDAMQIKRYTHKIIFVE